MPLSMLTAATEAMHRMRAQEALALSAVVQVGAATIKREAMKRMVGAWQKAARAGLPKRKLTPAEWRSRLAMMGVGVVHDDGIAGSSSPAAGDG